MPRLDATVELIQTANHRRCHDIALQGIVSGPTLESLRSHTRTQAESGIDMALNLAGLAYINSSGLGALVSLQDVLSQFNCNLVIYGARPEIMRLMVMLGLGEVLHVFETRDDAMAALDAGPATMPNMLHAMAKTPFATGGQSASMGDVVTPTDEKPHIAVFMTQNNHLTAFLQYYYSQTGGSATVLNDADKCAALLADTEHPVRAVILDASLPNVDAIRERIKTDPAFGLVSIITICDAGTDNSTTASFRVMEDELLTEPFGVSELLVLLQAEIHRCNQESVLFRQEVHFEFVAATPHLDRIYVLIEELLAKTELAEDHRVAFHCAVREAIDNSRRHGYADVNAGVIDLLYVLDREKITITVEDDGPGFDYEAMQAEASLAAPVEQARKRHRMGKMGGLGINLMMRCCDKLEYIAPGNIVKLTKYLT